MVPVAKTIINERAVMIVQLDALVANRAMERCLGLDHFAVRAEIVQVLAEVEGLFNQHDEIKFALDATWI